MFSAAMPQFYGQGQTTKPWAQSAPSGRGNVAKSQENRREDHTRPLLGTDIAGIQK